MHLIVIPDAAGDPAYAQYVLAPITMSTEQAKAAVDSTLREINARNDDDAQFDRDVAPKLVALGFVVPTFTFSTEEF